MIFPQKKKFSSRSFMINVKVKKRREIYKKLLLIKNPKIIYLKSER